MNVSEIRHSDAIFRFAETNCCAELLQHILRYFIDDTVHKIWYNIGSLDNSIAK